MEEHKHMCGGNCESCKNNSVSQSPIGEEEKEIEIFEFSLDENEINELIAKLVELKHTKTNVNFEIDDENDLLINYEDGESGEVEE